MLHRIWKIVVRTVGLQTPGGRLLFFAVISIGVFIVPYNWLAQLSIWQALDIPSPSVGLTRAYWLLIHGDPVGAWERNKLIYLVIAIGVPVLVRDILLLRVARRGDKTTDN